MPATHVARVQIPACAFFFSLPLGGPSPARTSLDVVHNKLSTYFFTPLPLSSTHSERTIPSPTRQQHSDYPMDCIVGRLPNEAGGNRYLTSRVGGDCRRLALSASQLSNCVHPSCCYSCAQWASKWSKRAIILFAPVAQLDPSCA